MSTLSYSRFEVLFLKFMQPAYKCQDGVTAGMNLVDHHIAHPNFTDKKTKV